MTCTGKRDPNGRYRMARFPVLHCTHLVRGRHDDQVRDAPEIGEVEGAVVRGTVISHQTRSIQNHAHRQSLKSHVVDHLQSDCRRDR